ncbi:hypothetical protein [Cellulomonas triticagri]|uniref:Uncharacterized protein n=1 Tax=Cellulomonas triticagri TaxID=2483352 RepID=A0A3M2J9R2_9CELL|nr:hypothetical protein [Cellulomonas triticagri]RMI09684.1 hypothetical protein EBM89_09190 [Cellulomonas triticagri]
MTAPPAPTPSTSPAPRPSRAARAAAAAEVGWTPLRWRDLPAVAWTTACDGVPARGRVSRTLLAAWCWPARLVVVPGGRYHRDGRRVTVSLTRVPAAAIAIGVALGLGTRWLLDLLVPRDARGWAALVIALVLAYVLSLCVLQWLRNRAERTPEERRGLFRSPAQLRTTWWLGRVATRDASSDRRAALASAAALARAVTAPGETVGAAAKSDRQQAELEAAGFAEPRGHKGLVVYPPPPPAGR